MIPKIKVLNIFLDGRLSGPVRRIIDVGINLSSENIETIPVFPEVDDEVAILLHSYNIKYYTCPLLTRLRKSYNPIYFLLWLVTFIPALAWLSVIIKKEKVKIIHCNGLTQVIGPLAGKLCRIKVVWHLNDVVAPSHVTHFFKQVIGRFADKTIFASEAVRQHFGKVQWLNWEVVFAPVDTMLFKPDDDKQESAKRLIGFDESTPVVGMVANINKLKGILDFVHSAAIVREHYPDVRFIHIGAQLKTKADLFEEVKLLIDQLELQSTLQLLGKMTNIQRYLQVMDIYVIPSLSEACPISLLEAMAMAKPIVATCVGGIPELVQDREEGFLVPPRQPEMIAEKILYYLNHPDVAQRYAKNARTKAQQQFDIRKCAAQHARIYQELSSS